MKKSIVQEMDFSGVDIFRINLSHTKLEDFPSIVKDIQDWTQKTICVDTEGAQIRTGIMKDGQIFIKTNSIINLTSKEVLGDESLIPLYPIQPNEFLQIGDVLSLDFHSAVIQVIQVEKDKVSARVLFGGKVGSNKGVALDRMVDLPAFTQKDIDILGIAKKIGLNNFALSFASKKEDIEKLRSLFPYPVFVISKIESKLGLKNLRDICEMSDAILIDRGDLSRDVPIQKIGLVQKHILDVAQKTGTPVNVATNLLESMTNNFQPTRAEINDVTSTLLSGASGLVLAAETAIGKYPVESVRMVFGIARETQDYIISSRKDGNGQGYFNNIYDYRLIEPHGGVLVQNFMDPVKIDFIEKLPKIEVDEKNLLDIVQIAEGVYSPLKGFMDKDELMSVLDNYRLPSGVVWTLPILLQAKSVDKNLIGETVAVKYSGDQNVYAVMKISNIQEIEPSFIAKKWFGTDDIKHPGVLSFKQKGNYIISGDVWLVKKPFLGGQSHILSPRQTRSIFKDFGWQKIVGFHTRNVIHRGHEFIQREALDKVRANALFISPVIGPKKETDFSAETIIKSYEIMLNNNYYSPYPALIGAFNTYSRYSGPREAIFTALCRKNFGCSHFIVGRDHTGVGNYYSPDASQKLFEKLGEGLGIQPVMFDAAYFCQACNKVVNHCDHSQEQRLTLSGSELRRHLVNNLKIPIYLAREDVAQTLESLRDSGFKLYEDSDSNQSSSGE
ncbi:MAG: pyruvate kinase [Candidatus Nealsonbacteria bacterium]